MKKKLITVAALLLLPSVAGAATYTCQVFIDPDAAEGGVGSESSPINAWSDIGDAGWASLTYCQKRGTVYTGTKLNKSVNSVSPVIGAYGSGAKPILRPGLAQTWAIQQNGSGAISVFDIAIDTVGGSAIRNNTAKLFPIYVDGVDIADATGHGVFFSGDDGYVKNSTFSNLTGSAVQSRDSEASSGWEISYLTIDGAADGISLHDEVVGGSGHYIHHITANDLVENAIDIASKYDGTVVEYITITNAAQPAVFDKGTNSVIRKGTISDSDNVAARLQGNGTFSDFYIANVGNGGDDENGCAILLGSDITASAGGTATNNTIVLSSDTANCGLRWGALGSGYTAKNNIIHSDYAISRAAYIATGATSPISDYNYYYTPNADNFATIGVTGTNFSAWQAAGYDDQNGQNTDLPLLDSVGRPRLKSIFDAGAAHDNIYCGSGEPIGAYDLCKGVSMPPPLWFLGTPDSYELGGGILHTSAIPSGALQDGSEYLLDGTEYLEDGV